MTLNLAGRHHSWLATLLVYAVTVLGLHGAQMAAGVACASASAAVHAAHPPIPPDTSDHGPAACCLGLCTGAAGLGARATPIVAPVADTSAGARDFDPLRLTNERAWRSRRARGPPLSV
jgi:hypothetical protein